MKIIKTKIKDLIILKSQIFKDKRGFVSRKKFNSKGQEIFLSGSDDSSTSELNQIVFDQTTDNAVVTLSGSTNPIMNFVANDGVFRQDTSTAITFRDIHGSLEIVPRKYNPSILYYFSDKKIIISFKICVKNLINKW